MAVRIAFLKISRSFKKVLNLAPNLEPALNFGPHFGPIHQTFSITRRSFAIGCTCHRGYHAPLRWIFAFQRIL